MSLLFASPPARCLGCLHLLLLVLLLQVRVGDGKLAHQTQQVGQAVLVPLQANNMAIYATLARGTT